MFQPSHIRRCKRSGRNAWIAMVFFLIAGTVLGQDKENVALRSLADRIGSYDRTYSSERLYLIFDKPYYTVADTAWFKVFLLNAADRKASLKSNKVYIELLNSESKVLQTLVIPMTNGLGNGDIKLDPKLPQGQYTIRAYTNWMQNFGPGIFYQQRYYIGKPDAGSWLVSEQHQTIETANGQHIKLAARLTDLKGRPVVNQDLTLHLLEDRKGLVKADVRTAVDGTFTTELNLPDGMNTRKASLLLVDKQGKEQKVQFPFYIQGDDIDLQFMPEGGSPVAGLYSKMGFKAIGEDGLGVSVEGSVVNSRNEEIAAFKSLHNGMGSFNWLPDNNDVYAAVIKLPSGRIKKFRLPVIKPTGLALRADVLSSPDTIKLYVTGVGDDVVSGEHYLLAQGRDTLFFASSFKLTNGAYNLKIAKSRFPSGIVSFMLMNADGTPTNARQVYIDRHNALKIAITTDKPVYASRDSIGLSIDVGDKRGYPTQANMTVTVTDDSQVRKDAYAQNIASYFLLSSELKGHIEYPAWYFTADQLAARALDNLLLTQGWIGFDTEKVLAAKPTAPAFWAESDNRVEGELRNFFNRPAANRQVTLMSTHNGTLLIDTVSNSQGRFLFKDLPFSDTIAYAIKIHNAKGKEDAVGIKVNEFAPAATPRPDSVRMMPWYVNTDPALLSYFKNEQQRTGSGGLPGGANGKLLDQVNIKAWQKARLQGVRGEDIYFADLDIDDKTTTKQGNISLLNFLFKKYPEFHVGLTKYGERLLMKSAFVANVSIDSVWVTRYYMYMERPYEFFQKMLDNIPAAAVKNLVIYHKPTPNGKDWMAFVIVKTRSGNGPVLKETPGIYIYRPLPLYLPRDFYRPRYAVKSIDKQPDLRSTIHWEPNLVSDEKGEAKVSFYAASNPGTYTVTVEGTDMDGHFGVSSQKITIAPAQASIKP